MLCILCCFCPKSPVERFLFIENYLFLSLIDYSIFFVIIRYALHGKHNAIKMEQSKLTGSSIYMF